MPWRRTTSRRASSFSFKQLTKLDFENGISRRLFHHARAHAAAWGPGRVAPSRRVFRLRVNRTRFEDAFRFISDLENMQQVAFGTKDLRLDDGTVISIPGTMRIALREYMWKRYKNSTPEPGRLSRSAFIQMATWGTGAQQKSLAGLDNISQRCGEENFDTMEDACKKMIDSNRELASYKSMTGRIRAFEQFLKKEYVGHVETSSTVASHCIRRLTGGEEHGFSATCGGCRAPGGAPCKGCAARAEFASDCPASCGQHVDHCKMCDERFLIFKELRAMLAVLEATGWADHADYVFKIDKAEKNLDKYMAHRVRTHIEDVASRARRAALGPGQAEMTVDFKMKWTAMAGGLLRTSAGASNFCRLTMKNHNESLR